MSKKQISAIIGSIITIASALGLGGYSLGTQTQTDPVQNVQIKNLTDRVQVVEEQVRKNGNGIAKILGYLDK